MVSAMGILGFILLLIAGVTNYGPQQLFFQYPDLL
jgi:hypothetical protein